MKKAKFLLIIFAVTFAFAGILCACDSGSAYEISLNTELPLTVEVGDEIDYTKYFTVRDKKGNQIVVTEDLLDLSEADTSKAGSFTVTLTIGGESETITFTVLAKETENTPDTNDPTDPDDEDETDGKEDPKDPGDEDETDGKEDPADPDDEDETDGKEDPTDPGNPSDKPEEADLSAVFAKYADMSKWNFAVTYTISIGSSSYEEYYEYLGYNILTTYEASSGIYYTDYLGYNISTGYYSYYEDLGDGTYEVYSEDTISIYEYYYFYECVSLMTLIDLTELQNYTFVRSGDAYVATNPNAAANAVIGELREDSWASFAVYIENGLITKLVGATDDGYTEQFTLSKQGSINFTLPRANSSYVLTSATDVAYDVFDDEILAG